MNNNNFRFELSFKNIYELENKLNFCLYNKINKINIPCKGIIKKQFLYETIEFIGKNYKDLDVIYHYSLYHQYTKNRDESYLEFLKFLKRINYYMNREILLVSGSNKKKNFEVLDVINQLRIEENLIVNLGIAYNPYLRKYFNNDQERERLEQKISSGLVKSIWLQFGTDMKSLEKEVEYLKRLITKNSLSINYQNIKMHGSVLIPSKQFISRFKFRPWKGVYISDKYIDSLDKFNRFSIDLICFYLDNNIYPILETEFSSSKKLQDFYSLFQM